MYVGASTPTPDKSRRPLRPHLRKSVLWRAFGFTQGSELGRQSALPCHAMPCHAMSCSTYGEHQQNIDMHATVVTENIQSSRGTSLGQTPLALCHGTAGTSRPADFSAAADGQQSRKVMLCKLVMDCIARKLPINKQTHLPGTLTLTFCLQVAVVCRRRQFLRLLWLLPSLPWPSDRFASKDPVARSEAKSRKIKGSRHDGLVPLRIASIF